MRLAWEAMLSAAAMMLEQEGGVLELTSECPVEKVLSSSPWLAQIKEPRHLFLHSLLTPVERTTLGAPRSVRFAHRTFQEFFLAWYDLVKPGSLPAGDLPPTVKEWAQAIQEEGLIPLPFQRETALPRQVSQTVPREGRREPPDLEIHVHTSFRDGRTHFDFVLDSPSGMIDVATRLNVPLIDQYTYWTAYMAANHVAIRTLVPDGTRKAMPKSGTGLEFGACVTRNLAP